MNKKEAIEAMMSGKKVTHTSFAPHEFITMVNGWIVDEKGYHLYPEEFWNYRRGITFENGWSLYE